MERIITKIAPPATKQAPKLKRVAAYARVSSGREAPLHSLSAQVSHYSDLIQKTPGWEYAGVYADACVIIGQTGQSLAATGFAPFWSYTDSLNSTEGDNRRKTKFVVGSALTLWSFKAKRDSRPATDAIRHQLQGGPFCFCSSINQPGFHAGIDIMRELD